MKNLSKVSALAILALLSFLSSCDKPNKSNLQIVRIEKFLSGILDDDVRAKLPDSVSLEDANEGDGVRLVGKIVIEGDRIRLECSEMSIDFDAGEFTATTAEFLLVHDDTDFRFTKLGEISGRVGSNVISFSGDGARRIKIIDPKGATVMEVKGDASLDLNREYPPVIRFESAMTMISRIPSPSPTPASRDDPLS